MLRIRRFSLGVLSLGLSLALVACGGLAAPQTLDQRYQRAIADAQLAEPYEISHRLDRIVPDNPHLRWRTHDGVAQVLTMTWTSWHGYDPLVGQRTVLSRETWVTCAPELRTFIAADGHRTDPVLRAAQLLGLPPNTNKDRFVELWAAPENLFRPAANPDITTDTAPTDMGDWAARPGITLDFASWFTQLRASSYGPNGYPWTRLGYTYDWGSATSEEGLSEFVIRAGSGVDVDSVSTNAVYLN